MFKKLVSWMLIGVISLGIVGCGKTTVSEDTPDVTAATTTTTETKSDEEKTTKTVTDHAGVEVEIPTEINRIVIGNVWPLPAALSVYLGGAEKIVGVHPASLGAARSGLLSEIYPEILNAETGFIDGTEINVEELLKLEPDIVIGVDKDQAETLRQAGLPAVTVSVSNWDYDVVETYDQWIALFDQIFGESEVTQRVSAYSREAYEMIQARVSELEEGEKKKVLILHNYDDETMTTSSAHFFGQYWCDATGSINVANEAEGPGLIEINMEQVYEWNPDVIILSNFNSDLPEDLYQNAIGGDDWSTINAVKNGEVYKMPLGLYRTFTPGADTPVTLQWFAKTIYPELFEDIDIEKVTKEYYKEYHNIDMTDEQLERMYNPPRSSADGTK
jgi:iron complex transport system substrate-binding protein